MLNEAPSGPRIQYLRTPAEQLPLPDASFDLVTVALAFHWFDQSRFLAEARRVLRPSGWLVTSVDGFGTPGQKIDDYRIFDKDQLIQYPGFKLFYRLDKPLMSPSDVLGMSPAPLMVMYQ
jgi:ubiquinone/menaquinone biosynthesis C-methylase UbiE